MSVCFCVSAAVDHLSLRCAHGDDEAFFLPTPCMRCLAYALSLAGLTLAEIVVTLENDSPALRYSPSFCGPVNGSDCSAPWYVTVLLMPTGQLISYAQEHRQLDRCILRHSHDYLRAIELVSAVDRATTVLLLSRRTYHPSHFVGVYRQCYAHAYVHSGRHDPRHKLQFFLR